MWATSPAWVPTFTVNGSLIATASLGAAVSLPLATSGLDTTNLVTAPLWIAAIGIIFALALFVVRCSEDAKQSSLLMRLLLGTSLAGVGVIVGGGYFMVDRHDQRRHAGRRGGWFGHRYSHRPSHRILYLFRAQSGPGYQRPGAHGRGPAIIDGLAVAWCPPAGRFSLSPPVWWVPMPAPVVLPMIHRRW